jgi:ATP-dependent DNA ligase
MARTSSSKERVKAGAVPAEELKQEFPSINLPIRPPFPPMEAKLVSEMPAGPGWLYEPKWDGFRCLAFRKGDEVLLQSKAGQPLGRYFPELVEALQKLPLKQFVFDGEIVIVTKQGISFDDLLLRIHPAESRIRKLAASAPASYLLFDLIVDELGRSLISLSLRERRHKLEQLFLALRKNSNVRLSPVTEDLVLAQRWMREGGIGLDGIIAKLLDVPYASGERSAMRKIKRIRTADCVVGGFRYATKGDEIGSLLLGLYNDAGELDHVGFTSSFSREQRRAVKKVIEPLAGGKGFSGRAPGGPSRWSTERSGEWVRLDPKLVCEVRYDHFSGGRFRHGTKFLHWRPEKDPKQCTLEQVKPAPRRLLKELELAA